jgi:hypothetical protein
MIGKLRGRVSSAHVISLAALFVALGGTAFAAATIGTGDIKNGAVTEPKLHDLAVTTRKLDRLAVTASRLANSAVITKKLADRAVLARKLADLAVKTSKIRDAAVNSAKVADDSLTGGDILNDSLTGVDINEATLGAPTAGLQTVQANSATSSASPKSAVVECPLGTRYIGWSYNLSGAKTGSNPNVYTDVVLNSVFPDLSGRQIVFNAYEEEPTAADWTLIGEAICIDAD